MTAPQDPYANPGPTRTGAQYFSIAAIVCGVVALLVPFVGIVGIVLAVVANRRREPLWKLALGVAVAGTVVGFILNAALLGAST